MKNHAVNNKNHINVDDNAINVIHQEYIVIRLLIYNDLNTVSKHKQQLLHWKGSMAFCHRRCISSMQRYTVKVDIYMYNRNSPVAPN